jgi:hypothetical protein
MAAAPPLSYCWWLLLVSRGVASEGKLMAGNIVLMPTSRGTMLDPKTAQACAELLAETIWLLDKQIELAAELLGADRARLFLRAIEEHVADKLEGRWQLRGNQS